MSARIKTSMSFNTDGLDSLKRKLAKGSYAKVGVLGDGKASVIHGVPDGISTVTNGEIAIVQEFGSKSNNIPARSFLRMPLETKRKELLSFIKSPYVMSFLQEGDLRQVLKLLGIKAETIVQAAFATSGFGKWKPNAPYTIMKKGSSKPLIDTSELRKAVTSDVVTDSKAKGK